MASVRGGRADMVEASEVQTLVQNAVRVCSTPTQDSIRFRKKGEKMTAWIQRTIV
jgi:hypothetical protein